MATAAELAGVDPASLLQIEVTLKEEGVEWSGSDEASSRLTPE
jgi:hypothetical protein